MDFEAKAKEILLKLDTVFVTQSSNLVEMLAEQERIRREMLSKALKQCAEEAIKIQMDSYADINHCPLCGTRVKIVGKTTLHYEPVITPKDAARKAAEYFMYEIHKRPMESEEKICEEAIKHAIGEGEK